MPRKRNSTMGPEYRPERDEPALTDQRSRLLRFMVAAYEFDRAGGHRENGFRTIPEIAAAICAPECSVSAQLRHLRKPQFGGHRVQAQPRQGGRQWEYRVLPPAPPPPRTITGEQMDLI